MHFVLVLHRVSVAQRFDLGCGLDAAIGDNPFQHIDALLQLADLLAPVDLARSDGLAEAVLSEAPETDGAYERLIQNARQRRDQSAFRRLAKRYIQAAAQYGFSVNPHLLDEGGGAGRAAR